MKLRSNLAKQDLSGFTSKLHERNLFVFRLRVQEA